MSSKPSVLVVAPTARIAATAFAWVTDAGCIPVIAASFAAAKQHIDEHPSLLISEVRLGEYNGLHLALRAQVRGVPAVLIGEPDSVLEREATQLGAVYLAGALEPQDFLSAIQPTIDAALAAERPWAAETPVSFMSSPDATGSPRHPNPFRS
jgi:DNA-binding NtrC family response regulator